MYLATPTPCGIVPSRPKSERGKSTRTAFPRINGGFCFNNINRIIILTFSPFLPFSSVISCLSRNQFSSSCARLFYLGVSPLPAFSSAAVPAFPNSPSGPTSATIPMVVQARNNNKEIRYPTRLFGRQLERFLFLHLLPDWGTVMPLMDRPLKLLESLNMAR